MPKRKISEIGRTDILIKNEISTAFFEKLGIDPKSSYLMDVKKAIFKCFNLPEPKITVNNPRKTLAEQIPNNAYGIPITRDEMEVFMKLFGLSSEDEYSEINCRIEKHILG